MENQIICPHCKRTISNNSVLDSAVNKENLGSTFITCECGERITYWAITAQLRDQKKPGRRIQNWLHNIFKGKG
jgi:RNase P subunit RPR2